MSETRLYRLDNIQLTSRSGINYNTHAVSTHDSTFYDTELHFTRARSWRRVRGSNTMPTETVITWSYREPILCITHRHCVAARVAAAVLASIGCLPGSSQSVAMEEPFGWKEEKGRRKRKRERRAITHHR